MFVEEFSLDAVGVFDRHVAPYDPAPPLPSPGNLLGLGASLFLASDLFTACHVRPGGRLDRHPLSLAQESPRVLYTGEVLDQFDLDVFLGCVVKELRRERPARRSMRQYLTDIGRRSTPSYMQRLEASLVRLAKARLEIVDARFGCCFQLLDSVLVDRQWEVCRVKASPEAVEALGSMDGLDSLARLRFGLGGRPLAKWLAGLVWSLGGEASFLDLDRLRVLCGRGATPPAVFECQVLPALDTLEESGYVCGVQQWFDDAVIVSRNPGRTRATDCKLVR